MSLVPKTKMLTVFLELEEEEGVIEDNNNKQQLEAVSRPRKEVYSMFCCSLLTVAVLLCGVQLLRQVEPRLAFLSFLGSSVCERGEELSRAGRKCE